jgi:hypothetical protein
LTAISPMAHDALLHTEMNSGASCAQRVSVIGVRLRD